MQSTGTAESAPHARRLLRSLLLTRGPPNLTTLGITIASLHTACYLLLCLRHHWTRLPPIAISPDLGRYAEDDGNISPFSSEIL